MRTKLIYALILCVIFYGYSGQHSGSILMTPYLQGVTQNSIYVLIESSTTVTVSVEYGLTTTYGARALTETIETTTNSTCVHNVKLAGLTPNTLYHYRAIQGADTLSDATFRTAVLPGTGFRFAWLADCRTGTVIHDSVAKRIADANPAVSLYGGDLAHSSDYSTYKKEFFRPDQLALIARVPFFNATGNHEGWFANTKAFTQAPSSSSGIQDYFSVDYGDMHVLVLNTQLPYSVGSAQYNFAERDLSYTTKIWKIVIAHKHAYCSGGHGENEELKAMTTNIFEKKNVDMIISGHSHFYQHNIVNGIHHMIIGTAGAPLYNPSNAPYTVKSVKDYNFAIVDVSPDKFKMVVYNDRGAVLDNLILNKSTGNKSQKPGIR